MIRLPRLTMVLLLAIVVGGCGDESEPSGRADEPAADSQAQEAGRFVLAGSTCSYEGPTTIDQGQASFVLVSRGGTADFDLWRLNEGHEYAELEAHIDEEVRLAEEGLPGLGHPTFATLVGEASTDPEGDGTLTASLDPGEYGMACIGLEEDGAFVAAGPFTVE